jgi:hypothetical protein
MSLQSELGLIDRLITLSKSCRSPTLKALAPELKARKRKLESELEARSAEARGYLPSIKLQKIDTPHG